MGHHRAKVGGTAAALIAGITLGAGTALLWPWVVAGTLLTLAAWRSKHPLPFYLAVAALGAAWCVAREHRAPGDDVSRFVTAESRLARVVGVVEGPVTFSPPWRGAMGRFHYQRQPNTLAALRVEQVNGQPASGRLLLRVREADHVLAPSLHIEATGWLSPVRAPGNPGELDYRQTLRSKGISGQLSLAARGNWTKLGEARGPLIHINLGDAAEASLNHGMSQNPVRLALLKTLLLGRWTGDLAGVDEQFRDVGLAHVLSISGAHLAILLGLVWMACKLMMIDPPRAAMLVMAVLVLFLLAIPPFVPVVRAGIMAVIACGAVWAGRRIDASHTLALAAIAVLVWQPGELFSPGFQLSFLVVAALLSFTGPWLERLWPKAWLATAPPSAAAQIGRWVLGYFVASAIAFAVALPLVAHHFRFVSPHAIVLSVLSLPALTAVLGLGYAKILVGLVSPAAALLLAGPLRWSTDALLLLVREAHGWPGATIALAGEPSLAWTAACLAFIWAFLAGAFSKRRKALAAAIVLLVAWTVWLNAPWGAPAARVHALAVGNGSCLLVQTAGRTMMFDCGSQRYFDVALRSVNPALRHLGVRRIDVLVVSHSDIDHYCGVLDVADRFDVRRVWVTPQMMREARERPDAAAAFLLNGLQERGVTVEAAARGHRAAGIDVLWPEPGYASRVTNDESMVLRVDLGGRTLLLTGDIQQDAITRLLATGDDLRADVLELPHHGSIVAATADLLDAVRPTVGLQSCAADRVRDEPWRPLLEPRGIQRYVTARHGMVSVHVAADRTVTVDTFTDAVYDAAME